MIDLNELKEYLKNDASKNQSSNETIDNNLIPILPSLPNIDIDNIDLNDVKKIIKMLLIQNIGSGESEKVQEGTSRYEVSNQQEQLKKDYLWIENLIKSEKDDEYKPGNVNQRLVRKHITDFGRY